MISFKLVRSGIDIEPLLSALKAKEQLWQQITVRQTVTGSPHGDTESIYLRGPREQSVHAVFNHIEAIDYPALRELPEARALNEYLMKVVGATELGRSMIVSLKPGGTVTPHADEGAYADHYERFHIVLTSEIGNEFYVKNDEYHAEHVHMRPGEIWWFNHKKEHAVINRSDKARWHIITDCVAPSYHKERGSALDYNKNLWANFKEAK